MRQAYRLRIGTVVIGVVVAVGGALPIAAHAHRAVFGNGYDTSPGSVQSPSPR